MSDSPAAACAPWRRSSAIKVFPAFPNRFISVAAGAALAGCSLLPVLPPELPLLAPVELGAARSATQSLDMAARTQEWSLQTVVSADEAALTVIALGPLGQRAFTLRYDGTHIDAELSPYVPASLPPARVLADLELALWPLSAWQARLAGGDWQIAEPAPGLRRLRYAGRLVEEVHYAGVDPWTAPFWVVNLALGYTLAVRPDP